MNPDTLLYVMTAFVIVAAVALVIQAGTMIGLYMASKQMMAKLEPLIPKVEALIPKVEALVPKVETLIPKAANVMDSAQLTMVETHKNVLRITEKVNDITVTVRDAAGKANVMMDAAHAQVVKIDGVVTEATEKAHAQLVKVDALISDAAERVKVQMDHAELVIDDTVSRVHESVALVHNGINKPLREVSGVAAGLRAALAHIMRGGRPSPAQVTQDEEMFI